MNDSKKQIQYVTILRWIARIWSFLSVAFILSFVGRYLFSSEGLGTFEPGELIIFSFFPIGVTIGMIIAWKWEGFGGILTTCCLIGFHVTALIVYGKPDFVLQIELLAAPGILFVLYWLLSRKRVAE